MAHGVGMRVRTWHCTMSGGSSDVDAVAAAVGEAGNSGEVGIAAVG